jgi:tetratricopeptide (TPR) repeat protein
MRSLPRAKYFRYVVWFEILSKEWYPRNSVLHSAIPDAHHTAHITQPLVTMGLALTPVQAFAASICIICTSAFQQSPSLLGRNPVGSPPQQSGVTLFASDRKSQSAAEWARREEEKGRREREGDVVIGKTSAVKGATDYAIDAKATEAEWLRQASKVERKVYEQTNEGMKMLKMLRLEEAATAFDQVFKLKPNAYLWQAGIAKFYLGDLANAADIFARNAITFESKFGMPATEERIWLHACKLKLYKSMDKEDKKRVRATGGIEALLAPTPENETTVELLRSESRKAIRIARELFAATVANDYSGDILARAKLRAIGGNFEQKPKADLKMWKINAWFYLGLHYDVLGEEKESKECMKMALKMCPSFGNGDDIVHTLPMLHMARRDWFDNEEFVETSNETGDDERKSKASTNASLPVQANPVLLESIKASISKLKLTNLRDALKVRGLKTFGSKEELQIKLFKSLMNDAGLQP